MRNLAAVTLILATTLPLSGQAPVGPSAESVAERIWLPLESTPWGATFTDWQKTHPSATCNESRGDAWGGADSQWCYRCSQGEEPQVEWSFYCFSLDEPLACRLYQIRLWFDGPSFAVLEKAAAMVAARGRGLMPEIQLASSVGGERHPTFEKARLGLLAQHPALLAALAEDERLDELAAKTGHDIDQELARALGSDFPALPGLLPRDDFKENDPDLRSALVQLLEQARRSDAARRPALLLAAHQLAWRLRSDQGQSPDWERTRAQLAEFGVKYEWGPLGASWFYTGNLLWTLWPKYGETEWGELAFLLLLDRGWSTSPFCEEGADEFPRVIKEGEAFLAKRPESRQRGEILFMVAQAYETWWSLSRAGENEGYANPADYQEGAAAAREKAIAYYEEVLRLAPDSDLAAYARRQLPRLKLGIDTNQRRYFCVYD